MKRLFKYALTLAAATILFSACSREEEPIFDDSAANRLDKAKAQLAEDLTANGGKWVMEYFANENEQGYVYVMTFSKDGSVKIVGNNEWIGSSTREETSLWDVNTDNGIVLSFNTYNSIFHVFADPDNYSDGSGVDYTGKGHQGDYEFVYVSINDAKTKLVLKGKKHSLPILMHRLDPSVDDFEYMEKVVENREKMFSKKINRVILTYGPTGERFIVEDGAWGTPDIYPEAGDKITQTETANGIFTADGFRFMYPFQISTAASPSDSITIQSFKLQPDGSLLADGEYGAGSTIAAPALADVFLFTDYSWNLGDNKCEGAFATILTDLKAQTKAKKATFKSINFLFDVPTQTYQMVMNTTVRKGVSESPVVSTFKINPVNNEGKLKITLIEADKNASDALETYPAMQQFIDLLCSGEFVLSADSAMTPESIYLSKGEDKIVITVR